MPIASLFLSDRWTVKRLALPLEKSANKKG